MPDLIPRIPTVRDIASTMRGFEDQVQSEAQTGDAVESARRDIKPANASNSASSG